MIQGIAVRLNLIITVCGIGGFRDRSLTCLRTVRRIYSLLPCKSDIVLILCRIITEFQVCRISILTRFNLFKYPRGPLLFLRGVGRPLCLRQSGSLLPHKLKHRTVVLCYRCVFVRYPVEIFIRKRRITFFSACQCSICRIRLAKLRFHLCQRFLKRKVCHTGVQFSHLRRHKYHFNRIDGNLHRIAVALLIPAVYSFKYVYKIVFTDFSQAFFFHKRIQSIPLIKPGDSVNFGLRRKIRNNRIPV